ncbi:NUDIX hydrolase [Nonomuraea sp. ZG12]|uniref:NUDIX hydrolase n=1 Tax=Nonomuraea sp. ZG12 TaxID=3452207 RepID=UPI003F8B639C
MNRLVETRTVPWISVPHRMDVVLAGGVPPEGPVTSAFAFVLDAADRTLLTRVNRAGRGWEIPGGHLDPGETPVGAAVREVAEETGLLLEPELLSLFAWHRIELLAPPPAGYRYPALTYMLMFQARLAGPGRPTRPPAGSESTAARWLPRQEVERLCGHQSWMSLHRALPA